MNNAIEVLSMLAQIRDAHKKEENRLAKEFTDLLALQMNAVMKINTEKVVMDDLVKSSEAAGKLVAITDELKFLTEEMELLNQLIELFNGNQEEGA